MKRFFKIVITTFNRGNIIALAIGFILGGAFTAVVNSLANDIILRAMYKAIPSLADIASQTDGGIDYGKFVAALIVFILDVILISIAIYVTVITKEFLTRNKPKPAPPPPPVTNADIVAELKALNASVKLMQSDGEPRRAPTRKT